MDLLEAISSYEYELPAELIATQPLPQRNASRLLVLDRRTGAVTHRRFRDFPSLLRPGDLLVVNETQVVPARLIGERTATGGKWEGLFLGVTERGEWRIIGQTRGKLLPGECLTLRSPHKSLQRHPLTLMLHDRSTDGEWTATADRPGDVLSLLEAFGTVPLPPYIRRESPTEEDWERYQTSFARVPGAVAAPTAGLHFTAEVFEACRQRGVGVARVTLHVGLGTFRPIDVERLSEHRMHREWCELPAETVAAIEAARSSEGRIVAVGTTTVRTLESVAATGPLRAWAGETDLFIRPPYEFRIVDALLTNFHLPRSTLLVLVSAFAGRQRILDAYGEAVAEHYRFYSYGDAMFISDHG